MTTTSAAILDEDLLEPIAVIGLSLKFPQDATSTELFWEMLMKGQSSMTTVPKERFNIESFYVPETKRQDELPLQGAHFLLEDIKAFDARFFNISPVEASAMDPMQRLMLETAYRALENAGIPLEEVSGSKTSVYTGCFTTDYMLQLSKDPQYIPTYAATGVAASLLANRISWFFNLKGASVNLDSACSSSGMALDWACSGLRDRSCNMSIVGGCNLIFSPEFCNLLTNMNMLSHSSRSFSFDSRANGYSRGEGLGVVILKRLVDAISDGDTIRCVIRATGCNQDGHTPGITQPSSAAQESLIRETYRKGGLSMAVTRFCESHGTGTALGDPIEAMAIGCAFKEFRTPVDPLIVGALKSNIGHLEGASGIAGLIKAILCLEKGIIPANADFEIINSKIDPLFLCLSFPKEPIPWPTSGLRRASINSFGFGGSNAHMVIDDAFNFLKIHDLRGKHCTAPSPPDPGTMAAILCQEPPSTSHKKFAHPKLCVLSADSEISLAQLNANYADHLYRTVTEVHGSQAFVDSLAYTLSSRRTHLPWRSYFIVQTTMGLQKADQLISHPIRKSETAPRIGFVFTGQGSQSSEMGRELLQFPIFQRSVGEADTFLRSLGCDWSVLDHFMYLSSASNIDIPMFSQTLCTVLQIALVELLSYFGIKPSAVVGHSSGEIAAAYANGALSKESALKAAYYRGVLTTTIPKNCPYKGAMLAVALSAEEVSPYFSQVCQGDWRPVVACYNSPKSITVSGNENQIDQLISLFDSACIFNRKLRVPVAYHSPQMEEIAAQYLDSLGSLSQGEENPQTVGMISSVTGEKIPSHILSHPEYWVRNMVSPVHFSRAVQNMCAKSPRSVTKKLNRSHHLAVAIDYILEVGPHGTLKGPVLEILKSLPRRTEIPYDCLLSRNRSASDTFLNALGRLYCAGYKVDLKAVNELNSSSSKATVISLTNLPEYPFNHSQKYWHESRISSDWKHQNHGHLELLGRHSLDWNPLDPRWRNFLKIEKMPWIEDHKINGVVLYPAAGMIVMAIEAVRQINLANQENILGFQLSHLKFSAALYISSNQGELETQISLHPRKSHPGSEDSPFDFVICSYANGKWVENCRGMIRIHSKDGHELANENIVSNNRVLLSVTPKTIQGMIFYQFLLKCGYGYGPAFRRIEKLQHNGNGEAIAEVSLYNESFQPHVIHPATLDAIMHTEFAALSDGCRRSIGTLIPTKIESIWIASTGLGQFAKGTLKVFTKVNFAFYRYSEASYDVFGRDGLSLVRIKGLQTTAIANATNDSPSPVRGADQILSYVNTEVDIDMTRGPKMIKYLSNEYPEPTEPTAHYSQLRSLVFHHLQEVKNSLSIDTPSHGSQHTNSYIEWIDSQLQQNTYAVMDYSEEVLQVEEHNAELRLYTEVGKQLFNILTGKINPSQFLFKGSLLTDYYLEKAKTAVYFKRFLKYVDLMAHKNPGMKILEIGAGLGILTDYILNTLQHHSNDELGILRCNTYHFTDIGPSFVGRAKETFAQYSDKLRFDILDIEKDPLVQGFEAKSYDLVIAISVLHATRTLEETLHNVQKLLKPGGTFILQEPTTPTNPLTAFVFGILPGWWLGTEEKRKLSPLVDEDTWNSLLLKTGFTGTNLVLRDHESEFCHEMSFMISRAAAEKSDSCDPLPNLHCKLIVQKDSLVQQTLAKQLQKEAQSLKHICDIINIQQAAALTDLGKYLCIFMPELEHPFLPTIEEKDYNLLKTIMRTSRYILWLTRGGNHSRDPGYAVVDGFARSLRLETSNLKFVTLALHKEGDLDSEQIQSIFLIMIETFQSPGLEDYEREYIEIDGVLYTRRIVEANLVKADFLDRLAQHETVKTIAEATPLSLNIEVPGQFDTIHFIKDVDAKYTLDDNQVEIEVKSVGLGFHDYLVASGRLKDFGIGSECSGIVRRATVKSGFHPGDRVWMYGSGMCRTLARSPASLVTKLPENISFEEACSLPVGSIMISYALNHGMCFQKVDSLLIRCTRTFLDAAVQIALQAHADLYVFAANEVEIDFLSRLYGIPRDHIVSGTCFSGLIKRLTKGKGVDMVLNFFEEGFDECFECVSPFGTFVDILDYREESTVSVRQNYGTSNITFVAINSAALAQERPHLLSAAMERVIASASIGTLRASKSVKMRPLSEAKETFEQLGTLKDNTKAVLYINLNDEIKIMQSQKQTYDFKADATYIISGGLGGLGRSVARWMARKGAKNLLLLSRSGAKTEAAKKCVSDLQQMGIYVETPLCDVSSREDVTKILFEYQKTMPKVRGCIHLSNVGKYIIFEHMTYSEWQANIGAKAQGAWNLHEILPRGLEFFVMSASIAGILGGPTLAGYSSSNSYLDGLARYRLSIGEKAIAMDFGVAEDDGVLAEDQAQFHRFMLGGKYIPLPEHEILALLDYACDPTLHISSARECQLISGIETPARIIAKGLELPDSMRQPLWKYMHQVQYAVIDPKHAVNQSQDLAVQLDNTSSTEEGGYLVTKALIKRVTKTVSITEERLDLNTPMNVYGVDSLTAVDLRNWFAKTLGIDVAVFEILGDISFTEIGLLVARKYIERPGK